MTSDNGKYEEPELSYAATRDAALLIVAVLILVAATFMAMGYINDGPQARSEPQFEQIDCESCIRA